MLCGTALGKLPLVLTPFANLTIVDESPEIDAKLTLIAQQKLSPFHCFTSEWPAGSYDEQFSTYKFASCYPELAQIYRIYSDIRMSLTTGAAELEQLKRIRS